MNLAISVDSDKTLSRIVQTQANAKNVVLIVYLTLRLKSRSWDILILSLIYLPYVLIDGYDNNKLTPWFMTAFNASI